MSKFSFILRLFSKSEKQTQAKKILFQTIQIKNSGIKDPKATLIELIDVNDATQVLPSGKDIQVKSRFLLSETRV